MADIFFSYANDDRGLVRPLVEELAAHGWSVWWDRQIPPGRTFDEVIEEALDEAKTVIAVWTENGVSSRWVRSEAAEGAARGILVPVLMADARIPLEFRRIQAADLADWEPGREHAGYAELIASLEERIGTASLEEPAPPPEPEDPIERAADAAKKRGDEKDWEGVITLLGPLAANNAALVEEHAEAAGLLALARRKREAAETFEEAEVLYADGRWADVIARFDQIVQLDPASEYSSELAAKAQQHIDEAREQRLAHEYERATEVLETGEWAVAVARFEQLMEEAPDYRDAAHQLERARAGVDAERPPTANTKAASQQRLDRGEGDSLQEPSLSSHDEDRAGAGGPFRWVVVLAAAVVLFVVAGLAFVVIQRLSDGSDTATSSTAVISADPPPTTAQDEPSAAGSEAGGDVVKIEFWHAMAGDLGAAVDDLVDEYNSSQDAVQVNSTFQGSYNDTFNAFTAALQAGTAPNIVQNSDDASQTMIDIGALVPAYELMPEGAADTFVPAARDYYSDQNGMVALPFNIANPIVYYNADKLAEAGVGEPAKDWTFTDFMAACEALEATGTKFCVTFGTVGWYFEQILANSGGLYFDNNNGRSDRATAAMFNDETGVEVFEFLTGLIADGHAPNLGNTWSDTDTVFLAGDAAMIFDSTSRASGLVDNPDFEVKTAYIPHTDSSERNGVVIGGGALWLIDSEDDAKDAASWDFMSFITQEVPQAVWHMSTGYLPVVESLETNPPDELVTFWKANPNFRTAIDQLADTNTEINGETNYPVLGGRAGPFPEIRQLVIEAYSAVLKTGATPQEALDAVAEQTRQILAAYNALVE